MRSDIECISTGEVVHTYSEYMQTSHWINTRSEAYKVHGKQCVRCKSRNNLNMHHLTYERIGRENVLFDLVPLCRNHHIEAHFTNPKAKYAFKLELTGKAKINALKMLNDKWVREENECGKKSRKWMEDEKGEVLRVIRNSHYNSVYNNLAGMYDNSYAYKYMIKDPWFLDLMSRKYRSSGLQAY